jgi:hypothetical protein
VKKVWNNYEQFRHLEPSNDEFIVQQETKLNEEFNKNWTPKTRGYPTGGNEPCGGEYAIPIEEMD